MTPMNTSRIRPAELTDARASLRNELHRSGLRATPARIAVLHALRRAAGPVTHAEIGRSLEGHGFDAATIYRNLLALTDAGVVDRGDHGDHLWRFEIRREGIDHRPEGHAHFLCTGCGNVTCLPDLQLDATRSRRVPRSARVGRVEVQLRGLCDDCDA
jgi:Fur family ferric uptake transcriptional regulator